MPNFESIPNGEDKSESIEIIEANVTGLVDQFKDQVEDLKRLLENKRMTAEGKLDVGDSPALQEMSQEQREGVREAYIRTAKQEVVDMEEALKRIESQ